MDPVTIGLAAMSALNILNQEDEKKKSGLSVTQRSGVKPVQDQSMPLGSVLGLGQAGMQMHQGIQPSAPKPSADAMGPANRALDAQTQADTFQRAQGALQYAPEDLRNTLGPVFSDAIKRQSRRY
jgi:hypothetical protein